MNLAKLCTSVLGHTYTIHIFNPQVVYRIVCIALLYMSKVLILFQVAPVIKERMMQCFILSVKSSDSISGGSSDQGEDDAVWLSHDRL